MSRTVGRFVLRTWRGRILRIARQEGWTIVDIGARALRDLWRAIPGDLLGIALLAGCGVERRPRSVPVLDDEDRLVCVGLVVEDPRLGRVLDAVALRPVAMTFGRHVLARRSLPESTVRHELEHVRQWTALGPLFLPAYVAASAWAVVSGGDRYRDNRFERAARLREAVSAGGEPATAGFDRPG